MTTLILWFAHLLISGLLVFDDFMRYWLPTEVAERLVTVEEKLAQTRDLYKRRHHRPCDCFNCRKGADW